MGNSALELPLRGGPDEAAGTVVAMLRLRRRWGSRRAALHGSQVAIRQGDAAVFRAPCGELVVFDTNRFRSAEVLDVLDAFGSRQLAFCAISHYDSDHLGGVLDVATLEGLDERLRSSKAPQPEPGVKS